MNEKISYLGKGDFFSFFMILSSLNWLSNFKSGFLGDFIQEDKVINEYLNWIYKNTNGIFESGNFFNSVWNSMIEYIMIVIFCKRQFTLNSSFSFALSLLIKNLHLPWIQSFRSLEILKDQVPLNMELITLFTMIMVIYLEANISKSHMHFSKRRLANCVVGSEIISIALFLKGLCLNKIFTILSTNFNEFNYDQMHCFYLRVVIFSSLSFSHFLSLINLGLTKKVIFKFYVFTRIFQSTKELIENFSELNRFRKMTISLNYSMNSPTKEDLENLSDQLCIICRDEITQDTSKKLSCGHIYHIDCLQNWMIRQYCCPTCLSVISSKPKDPLRDVDKKLYNLNTTKTDLLGLVVGCRVNGTNILSNTDLKYKTISIPSLEPDLSSLVYFKGGSFKFTDFTHGKGKQAQYLNILERLFKIRNFIFENLVKLLEPDLDSRIVSSSTEIKSFSWKGEQSSFTERDIERISTWIPLLSE